MSAHPSRMLEPDRSDKRINTLRSRPLSARTMNAHLGSIGAYCDVTVPPGWLSAAEKMFDTIEALPTNEWPQIIQIKEKLAELRVYHSGGSEAAKVAIGRAIGEAAHACQFCGSRARFHLENGWYATLCVTHSQPGFSRREPTPGIGTPFPVRPVLVGVSARSARTQPIWVNLNGTEYGLNVINPEMAAFFQRFLDPIDAIALALDPAEVGRSLEDLGVGPIALVDARNHARAGAARLGLDPWAVETAISEAAADIDARPAWRLLARAVLADSDPSAA